MTFPRDCGKRHSKLLLARLLSLNENSFLQRCKPTFSFAVCCLFRVMCGFIFGFVVRSGHDERQSHKDREHKFGLVRNLNDRSKSLQKVYDGSKRQSCAFRAHSPQTPLHPPPPLHMAATCRREKERPHLPDTSRHAMPCFSASCWPRFDSPDGCGHTPKSSYAKPAAKPLIAD